MLLLNVLVEIKHSLDQGAFPDLANLKLSPDFHIDEGYPAVRLKRSAQASALETQEQVFVIRGSLAEPHWEALKAHPQVLQVWHDAVVSPFQYGANFPGCGAPLERWGELLWKASVQAFASLGKANSVFQGNAQHVNWYPEWMSFPNVIGTPSVTPEALMAHWWQGFAPSPPPEASAEEVDYFWWIPKGTLAQAATLLQADQLWKEGIRGEKIVIGVVDGGMSALGRSGEVYGAMPQVLGGWPETTWGQFDLWGGHANMVAFDALGCAPEVSFYDIRIAPSIPTWWPSWQPSLVLQGYQWALNRYHLDGTPQILLNCWGLGQKETLPDFVGNADHPLARKIEEMTEAGMMLTFAAGNAGSPGTEALPESSMWGVVGHPHVMTVGAFNLLGQAASYNNSGPALLAPEKPDFCGVSHFWGYFPSFKGHFPADIGTSAACGTVAGILALLKQAHPALCPAEAQAILRQTARHFQGAIGYQPQTGYGLVQAKAASDFFSAKKW